MHHSLFVTGTDTGVGKTLVTALLVLKLQNLGIDVGVMKPIASGCENLGGKLVSEDTTFLINATATADAVELVSPILLEEPLAPLVAARRAGVDSAGWMGQIIEAYRELKRRHECVVVEGVGGLLVPIAENAAGVLTCRDLAGALGLPTVVVCRRALGTINHTLLTCQRPLPAPAYFAGLYFNDAVPLPPEGENVAMGTSPQIIGELTGMPILGQIPFAADQTRTTLQELAKSLQLPE